MLGTVLDAKYRILRPIGTGGMGIVFEAEDLIRDRFVAIKIVGGPGSAEAHQRLAREARLISAVRHPNICDVYDVGELPSGGPYVVLERLFGGTLAAHTQTRRRLAPPATVDIFAQVLSGLQAAHTRQILHRDLKPQNVFLTDCVGCPPVVKIVDFGFAKDLSAGSAERLTRPGRACGTLQYMSPEQLRAEPLDHRSDLFSVGVMLYEALTGRHPFAAVSRIELQMNILRAEPKPLREHRPDLPIELERIVACAMAKDLSRRPTSAYAMQTALSSAGISLAHFSPDLEAESETDPMTVRPSSSSAA